MLPTVFEPMKSMRSVACETSGDAATVTAKGSPRRNGFGATSTEKIVGAAHADCARHNAASAMAAARGMRGFVMWHSSISPSGEGQGFNFIFMFVLIDWLMSVGSSPAQSGQMNYCVPTRIRTVRAAR